MAQSEATLLVRIKEMGSAALSKVGAMIDSVADKAKWAAAAVVGFGALAVKNFMEQEAAVNELNAAMVNAGIYTAELSKKYQDQASALQNLTTFGDEAILSAQAALQMQIGQTEVTENLTKAVLDLAAGQKMDLVSAAQLVGKSIGSSTNALARYGIELDAGASKGEKITAVIEGINRVAGGQAEAAAQGLGGIKQLKNAFSDFLEVVGEKLAPSVVSGSKVLTTWFKQLGSSAVFLNSMNDALNVVGKTIIYLKAGILNLGAIIGGVLGAAFESISLVAKGQFSKAKDIVSQSLTEIGQTITENMAAQDAELKAFDELQATYNAEKRAEEQRLLAESLANQNAVRQAESAKQLEIEKKKNEAIKKEEEKKNAELIASRSNFLSHMASLQSSSNSTLAAIGKAAALAQITISTAQAAMDGFKWGMSIGGPPLAAAFSGLAYAAGAAQAAQVAGVKLADGGVIKATPGGVPAIIGEGGRDEAVIPLDDNGLPPGMGGGVQITINGNMIGDEASLYALAKMLDPQMLKLRQNNESVAFDTGVI